ncbi:hypothetical protein LCGC14_2286100 [marine sediment metagenome]|uniref:Uncharacterized protein n=1 Tax=marine sediment metagenome TaxID=412755 RepID=A0A0F9DF40_9ZZZZ
MRAGDLVFVVFLAAIVSAIVSVAIRVPFWLLS